MGKIPPILIKRQSASCRVVMSRYSRTMLSERCRISGLTPATGRFERGKTYCSAFPVLEAVILFHNEERSFNRPQNFRKPYNNLWNISQSYFLNTRQ